MQISKSLPYCSLILCLTVFATLVSTNVAAQTKRRIGPDDFYRMRQVGDPQVSPDGKWIAYTVTSVDRDADRRHTAVWIVDWEGTQNLQMTFGTESASAPRWSPDGKYLSFLASRKEGKSQVWLLDRRGGEAQPLTDVKRDIESYTWSPDGKQLALQLSGDEETSADADKDKKEHKAPKPIVIDRYQFKEDVEGYLTDASRSQISIFDVAEKKLEPLTNDRRYDDQDPTWSPDSSKIAFVSDRTSDPDQTSISEIYVIDAKAGATPQKIAAGNSPSGQRLRWSPDGKSILYLEGFDLKYGAYNQNSLRVVSSSGGVPKTLAEKLDRGIVAPEFTEDGQAITFAFDDDRKVVIGRVPVNGGEVERITNGGAIIEQRSSAGGHTAVTASTDTVAPEIFALESGKLRKLSAQNDALLGELQLGTVEDFSAKAKDGNEVHGLMTKPPDYQAGKKYPMLLWIHGGPDMQDDHALPFNLYPLQVERQMFAAQGYVVLAVNYRGSTGRGAAYTKAIAADWGNKEVLDLLAAVDYAVSRGVADPNRLGVGGWSYGGMLTDFTIASDTRFKVAMAGAGIGNELGMYGGDQYIRQYNNEIGPPWKNLDTWIKISYPFYKADRIKTPTLFMGGRADFNVPIIGGEQMYQALRSLGVPTQLVIYPDQFHLFTRPSYIHDRMERYLAWWDKYLKQ
ncbi:MAG TPA: S9 family peptidase [Candidatus Sulfotelmatobacter sp.]|nr:S9 family peptidase [Candidatus Sulfotelmatobacter sp.]